MPKSEKLQEAMAKAGEEKTELRIGNPFFDPDIEDRKRLFYTTPQQAAARKGLREVRPAIFDPKAESPVYGEKKKLEDAPEK